MTDHKPLDVIYGPRSKPCGRTERWLLRLQSYDFKIPHVPGMKMIADPLSRLLKADAEPSLHRHGAEEYVRFVAGNVTPRAFRTREIEEISRVDEEIRQWRHANETGQFENCNSYMPIARELCVIGKLVLCGARTVLPTKLRPRALDLTHKGHVGTVGTKQRLCTRVCWPGKDKAATKSSGTNPINCVARSRC